MTTKPTRERSVHAGPERADAAAACAKLELLTILAFLQRSYEDRIAEVVRALSPTRQQALADLCRQRSHGEPLAVLILSHCSAGDATDVIRPAIETPYRQQALPEAGMSQAAA
ncbi:hypothetical protein [Mangrovibrevibacter kandeliae]|uniref:hypothetical protein n=1 Tax=Mangrovibrevibacter kandeliae TaxID=2968473 RepID=UPI002118276C|nr:hypothetical protein [Aurantimonas sp. CSK15Z-1]MCQ8782958.1 hypothetical protein [Aurantimonas sp. CSK15Z-1]